MTEHPSGRKEDHQKKEVVVSNKPAPEKKEGLFAYFKSSWTEFKKVVWPSRDEAVKMTVFVITEVTQVKALDETKADWIMVSNSTCNFGGTPLLFLVS